MPVRNMEEISRRRHVAFAQLMRLFPPASCVDLGAGHGSFSVQAAKMGWSVTAVDARSERWPDDDRVTWMQADVRDVQLDRYDVVLCLGLFYHLTLDDQVELLRRASGRPVIIDTHLDHGDHEHELSEPVTVGGYRGRLYREPGQLTSSWGNARSFWPTLDAFHQMLRESGYDTILTLEPWLLTDRTFFLALPSLP